MRVHVSTSSGPGGERVSGSITWSLLMVRASSLWLHWAASINCRGGEESQVVRAGEHSLGVFLSTSNTSFWLYGSHYGQGATRQYPWRFPLPIPLTIVLRMSTTPELPSLLLLLISWGGGMGRGQQHQGRNQGFSVCVFLPTILTFTARPYGPQRNLAHQGEL